MTRRLWIAVAVLVAAGLSVAFRTPDSARASSRPEKAHRVVFEVNVDGLENWGFIMNNVENLQKALGPENTEIALVMHGKGVGMLMTTDAPLKERMEKSAATGVVFAACQNTMRRKNIKNEDLLPFATTVPSGVTDVVLKQEAGWSYIKGGS